MTRFPLRRIAALAVAAHLGFLPSGRALADTLIGEVVGLSDGDTVTVLDSSNTQHRIRLSGIDAPEKNQPFGTRSRQSLSDLVFLKRVTVEYTKTDRYGRIVGKVLVGNVDTSLEQVKRGLAWHYKAYEQEQSAVDRIAYSQAEDAARGARRGLWQEPEPLAPWDFRRRR